MIPGFYLFSCVYSLLDCTYRCCHEYYFSFHDHTPDLYCIISHHGKNQNLRYNVCQ